jgi:RNA polymerase sigma factor (sigma-70 family)
MAPRTHLGTATGCSTTQLLESAARGDQAAWGRLVEEYDGLVRSVARSFRLQAADVHDVAQATWLRLVQHLHTIHDPERLAGWLAVTARREALSTLRKASREAPREMVDQPADSSVDLEGSVVDREVARELWDSVDRLPPRQQRLLIALFREELDSYDVVAARCAMPIGSIGPTRARGLSRLRREITDRGLGPAEL